MPKHGSDILQLKRANFIRTLWRVTQSRVFLVVANSTQGVELPFPLSLLHFTACIHFQYFHLHLSRKGRARTITAHCLGTKDSSKMVYWTATLSRDESAVFKLTRQFGTTSWDWLPLLLSKKSFTSKIAFRTLVYRLFYQGVRNDS